MPPPLLLIGLRGSGKSTLGRLLARRLGRAFLDLDDAVLEHLGFTTVADAWTTLGEPAFRKAETECLRACLTAEAGRPGQERAQSAPDAQVVALGGGTPTAPGAADLLRDASNSHAATIVYLRARPDTLRARLGPAADANRPALTDTNTLDEVDAVFAARDPLYQALATEIIQIDSPPDPHHPESDTTIDALVDRLCTLANNS